MLTRYWTRLDLLLLLHQLQGNASFGVGVVGVDAVLDEHPIHLAEHLLLFAAAAFVAGAE